LAPEPNFATSSKSNEIYNLATNPDKSPTVTIDYDKDTLFRQSNRNSDQNTSFHKPKIP
jgi:hypothetical protein